MAGCTKIAFPRSDRPRSCRKVEHLQKVTGAMVDVDFGETRTCELARNRPLRSSGSGL